MGVIRTDASRSEGGESSPQATAGDSWRTWTHETPDDFFYLRQNRESLFIAFAYRLGDAIAKSRPSALI